MGNQTICNCNFKQEQQEEDMSQKPENTKSVDINHNINQFNTNTNVTGIPLNTNMNTISDLYRSGVKSEYKQPRAFVYDYNQHSINFKTKSLRVKSLSKTNKYLSYEQKDKYSYDFICSVICLQSVIKSFIKRLKYKREYRSSFYKKSLTNNYSASNNVTNEKEKVKFENSKNEKIDKVLSISDITSSGYNTKSLFLMSPNENESFGIQIWKDGAIYKGMFTKKNVVEDSPKVKDSGITNKFKLEKMEKNEKQIYKADGIGIFRHAEGDIYKGEFSNDETNGFGIYTYSTGATYEGFWKEDNQCGYGIEEWKDGSNFKGIYENGMKQGIGTYNWSDGSTYSGEWDKNDLHGYGIYTFADGRIYMGEWQNNSMHGFGEFFWSDGKKYVGYYVNDKKEGFGMYIWHNPIRLYIGFWLNGKQHGLGKYYSEKNINQTNTWGLYEKGNKSKIFKTKEEAFKILEEDQIKFINFLNMDIEKIVKIMSE